MRVEIDPEDPDPALIQRAVQALRAGGLVVFPTDTLYGLGADATNREAVRAVASAKGREPGKPFPVLVRDISMAMSLAAGWPAEAEALAGRFWPGGLTLILQAGPDAAPELVGPGGGIGLRSPGSRVAMELIDRLGRPITGTSANLAGGGGAIDPTTIEEELGPHVALILDAGVLPRSPGSTVVDLTGDRPRLTRHGTVDPVEIDAALREARSCGE